MPRSSPTRRSKIDVRGWGKPVFVGVGPAEAVDRYLAGASVETVTDVEVRPFELTTTVREGSMRLHLAARPVVLGRGGRRPDSGRHELEESGEGS